MNCSPKLVTVVLVSGLGALLVSRWVRVSHRSLGPEVALPHASQTSPATDPPAVSASPVRRGRLASEAIESAEGASAHILCVDRAGVPVRGVEAFVTNADADPLRPLGRTDPQGRITPASPWSGALLTLRHPDYAAKTVRLPEHPTVPVVVTLDPGGVLRGFVEQVGGAPAPRGTRVLAMTDGWPRARGALRDLSSDNPCLLLATPDAHGYFEIHGADPLLRYRLAAGCHGMMIEEDLTGVAPDRPGAPGAAHLRLILMPVYAVKVRLEAEGGGAPLTDRQLMTAGGVEWKLADVGARSVSHRVTAALLAGVSYDDLQSADRYDRVLLYLSANEVPAVGPIQTRIDIPGYAQAAPRLWAPPLAEGLAVRTVPLAPVAAGWGALTVRYEGGEGLTASSPTQIRGGPATLHLVSEGADHYGLFLRAYPVGEEEFVLPWGRYEGYLSAHEGLTRIPAEGATFSFDVDREPAELAIGVAGLGSLEVRIATGSDSLFEGAVLLRLRRTGERGEVLIAFECPPYRVCGIEPGDYAVGAMTGAAFAPPGHEPFHGRVAVPLHELVEITL
jgi:hypothetical protein